MEDFSITKNKISYTVACISSFAQRFDISRKNAFLYLQKNKGLDFLQENYNIEHTLSIDDAVDDLQIICKKQGGNL